MPDLVDQIPNEAQMTKITGNKNVQFVEKCDSNIWEAFLVRNDMNMYMATLEINKKRKWCVYDGTKFHPVAIPRQVDKTNMVVIPEGMYDYLN